MENRKNVISREVLLSKLLSEIEQLFSTNNIGDNESSKTLYVPSMSSQYPSYLIDIGLNRPQWMMESTSDDFVIVNVLFFETSKSVKGRCVGINPNEFSAKNTNLQGAMDILTKEVFDKSGGYDVSLYPTELEARNTLREIMDVGDSDDAEEVEDTPLDKEEIASLVDDLFETTMEEQ